MHAQVPFVDALTTTLDPSLPLTQGEWEEWGNPLADPDVYAYMKSYTPYENVRDVDYPSVLATTSLNDTRVFYVEPAKWVQMLRRTVTSDQNERPILLKTEMVAGHGGVGGGGGLRGAGLGRGVGGRGLGRTGWGGGLLRHGVSPHGSPRVRE